AAGASRAHEGDRGADRADSERESGLGLQSHPRRLEEPRPLRREKYRCQGAQGQWDPARTRAARNPDAGFMAQAARRLTDAVDGFVVSHRVLVCDRDSKWTDEFRAILKRTGVRVVVTPI